jgi:hypothetical protein
MKTAVDKICETCRYWSELAIRSLGPKHSLEALCLNREGPFYRRFCRGAESCPSWASGHLGAIDDPDLPEGAYANQGVAEPHNDADAAFDHFSNSTKHRPSSNDPLEGLPVEQDRTRHSVQARRGRLVLVIDAGCRVPELGGQLKPQTHVWTPEMTPKDDNTVAHITDRIDAACRELTKIADMLAGYPELHDICASLREVLAMLEVRRVSFDRDPHSGPARDYDKR